MSGYCKYCDSLFPKEEMIQSFDPKTRLVVWVGCKSCYEKKIEQGD